MKRASAADRRKQIIGAAYEVILEKGLSGAATRDVTRKLGVGSGLLHHYFPSWNALRAEAVNTFIQAELAELGEMLKTVPTAQAVTAFVDWMADEAGETHWRLWLNAIDTARRDADMADVIKAAYDQWHDLIRALLERLSRDGPGHCVDPSASAWRLSALIDGLSGIVLLAHGPLALDRAKGLVSDQFALELGLPPDRRGG